MKEAVQCGTEIQTAGVRRSESKRDRVVFKSCESRAREARKEHGPALGQPREKSSRSRYTSSNSLLAVGGSAVSAKGVEGAASVSTGGSAINARMSWKWHLSTYAAAELFQGVWREQRLLTCEIGFVARAPVRQVGRGGLVISGAEGEPKPCRVPR